MSGLFISAIKLKENSLDSCGELYSVKVSESKPLSAKVRTKVKIIREIKFNLSALSIFCALVMIFSSLLKNWHHIESFVS